MAVLIREAPPDGHVFKDIADAMPHMVWLAGPDGGTTYHNRRILEYAGLSAGVTLGTGWERLVHPDDVLATRATWLQSVGTGAPFETEYRLRRHDGAYRRFLARAHTQLDGCGEVVRWVGTCTDIEDQKGAESRFRAIIEKSFDAVDLVGADGSLIYSSPSSVRLLGVPVEEQLGRDAFELLHPDDRNAVREVFGRLVLTPGASADSVHRIRHADGRYLWLEFRATNLLFDPDLRAVVLNFRDVSDRVAADEAMRESERRYRELFESNPHPMWVYDTETLRFLAVNDAAVQQYGYARDEFLAMTVADIRPPEDVPALRADVLEPAHRLQTRGVWRHRWKDGTLRDVEVAAHSQTFVGRPARLVLALDVTDRLRAERELRRTVELLKAVADGTTDAVFVKDRDGKYLLANPAAARFVGRADGDVVGRTDAELFDPDSARWVSERDRQVMTAGVAETNVEDLSAAGVTRTYLATKAPYRDENGAVIGVIGITRDVTELKRSQESLRASDERLRLALRGAGGGAWDWNLDTGDIWWSPELYKLWGVQPGTPTDIAHSLAAIHADDRESINVALRQAIDKGADYCCEFRIHHPVLGERWMASYGQVARDESDRPRHLLGISLDATERKRLAEERDALLTRLQLKFARMPLAYVQFDADLRVSDWNPAAERIFGFSKNEVLEMGPPYEKIVPITFWAEAESLLARIKAGDMAAHSVNQNLTKDGRTITCEWFNTPLLDEGGRFTGLLCLAQDLTARLLLEEQFRQAQKMDAFGQLAGGVAHDFNNLLTIINGFSEIVLGNLPLGDPNRELLAEVHKAGERSAGLTRQLLAFSRQQVLAPRVLDLNEVVGDTASMLRRVIGEDVKLSTTTANGLWPVKADPGQVEQILLNLAVNARDAMPTGGKLTIETGNVLLDETYAASHSDARPGPHVLLAVSDSGCGMSAAVRAKIFEPFFTTKGPGKGTGLGLATVYGIVKQSGGHIGVYSEVGVGTTFKVYLPRTVQAGEGAKLQSTLRSPPQGTETVLVVEDDAVVRGLTRHILQHAGYAVLEAATGDEALRVATGHIGRIHLLVTDVVMPGLGGRAAAERLAERYHGLRVLFVSGYTDDAVVRHGVLHDKVNFLQKPFTPSALALKVREVLDAPAETDRM
jgi:two-component system, cell cycle sensor histidine kinase and response regulator CckA